MYEEEALVEETKAKRWRKTAKQLLSTIFLLTLGLCSTHIYARKACTIYQISSNVCDWLNLYNNANLCTIGLEQKKKNPFFTQNFLLCRPTSLTDGHGGRYEQQQRHEFERHVVPVRHLLLQCQRLRAFQRFGRRRHVQQRILCQRIMHSRLERTVSREPAALFSFISFQTAWKALLTTFLTGAKPFGWYYSWSWPPWPLRGISSSSGSYSPNRGWEQSQIIS